ncbi:MAG: UPF0182 family protein [Acidimicrobiales bacterium]
MRAASDMPKRPHRARLPTGRGRTLIIVIVAGLFVLIASLRGLAGFYTDYLWFDSIDQTSVWAGVLSAKGVLALIFTGAFFLLMWIDLLIADRLAPTFRPAGPEEELVDRYRALVGSHAGAVRVGVSVLFALIAGAGVSTQWQSWLLFVNAQQFGIDDPLFGRDVGFYVFQLPFLRFISDWLLSALIIVFVVTLVAHYLNGGIRLQSPLQRVTPQVKVHLSVLLALLALVKAGQYWLQQYALTTSTRGFVNGAGYTDVNVQLPAIRLLMLISLFALVLLIVNIFRRGWVLPVLAVGLWGLIAVIGGAVVPALVQRFRVQPAQSSLEAPYIVDNIAATREALRLTPGDAVELSSFPASGNLTDQDLVDNVDILRNVRLWDPTQQILGDTYGELQNIRSYFEIRDVDADRYTLEGRTTQVNVSVRELNTPGLSRDNVAPTWENQHLAYTHGFGVVMSPANAKDRDGRPFFLAAGVPVRLRGGLEITEPRVYVGEGLTGYVVVNTDRPETDYTNIDSSASGTGDETDGDLAVAPEQAASNGYAGNDGVRIGSFLRRAAFALRFGDVNLVVSGNLNDDSRLLMRRDLGERVRALAPFLSFDRDPYPVIIDGRIVWVMDAFTTTDRYPYAEQVNRDGLTGSDLDRRFNYVRNSVKVTVDAYDGDVNFYVVDETDPLARAWAEAFPDLFSDEEASEELQAHFRYPEDLFTVQTNMWGRYHQSDSRQFFEDVDRWSPAQDPGRGVATATTAETQVTAAVAAEEPSRFEPYYLLTRLPGDDTESFVMLRPYEPEGDRPVLISFIVARSDPGEDYGRLTSFSIEAENEDLLPSSPINVGRTMGNDPAVSQQVTLLGQQGSRVRFGNMLLVPIEESMLFVRPLYVEAQDGFPLLRRVIVFLNGDVAIGGTLREALEQLPQFTTVPDTGELPAGGATEPEVPPAEGGEEGEEAEGGETTTTEPGDVDNQVASLLAQASALFDEADAALRDGDLALYQQKVDEAQAAVDQAQALLGLEPAPDTTTTTTVSA